MIDLLGHRGFARLWLGDTVSMIGDWLTYVAVGVIAIGEGGPWAVLGVLLAHTLPRVLVAPWAGRLADRYDRRAVLAWGAAARGGAVLGMVAAALGGSGEGLVLGLVVRMAAGAFVDAAAGAAVPRLVPRAALARANALLGVTWSVVFGLGVAAGGLLTAAIGPVGVLLIDAGTFFVAALVFAGLPRLRPLAGDRTGSPSRSAGSWREALAYVGRHPALARAVSCKAPVMIANGGAWILVHLIAGQRPGAAMALTLGALHLARAVGTGLGPLVWVRAAKLRGTAAGLRWSTAFVLGGVAALAMADDGRAQALAALVWGVGMGAHWATAATRVQRLSPDPLRGRMAAIDLVVHTTGHAIGGGVGGLALAALGVGAATAGGSGVAVAVGLTLGVALLAWALVELGPGGGDRAAA